MTSRRFLPVLSSLALLAAVPAFGAEQVTVSLDWTPNTNHAGLYVAQTLGFYDDAGIAVEILPFPNEGPEADFQFRSVLSLFTLRTGGEDIMGVFAVNQREIGRLVFSGDRADIASPRDLEGLVYGGFGAAWEEALIGTMIANDGGEPDYETVALRTSVYDALDAGEVDFTLDHATWEGVQKELDGEAYGAFAYADYGVPDQHTSVVFARETTLAADPERAAAFIDATRRGYEYAVANPEEAGAILIAAAPELADQSELVHASLDLIVRENYFATPEGVAGLFDPDKMEALGVFLYENGALVGPDGEALAEQPDFSAYFTNALFSD